MQKIDISEVPVIEFDAGIPDTKWDEVNTCATTGIYCQIVAIIS